MSKRILCPYLLFFVLFALRLVPSAWAQSVFLQPELLQPPTEGFATPSPAGPVEDSGASSEDLLASLQAKQKEALLKKEYHATLSSLDETKAEQSHAEDVRHQGAAFTKEFLVLNPDSEGFPTAFQDLLKKYPLATEDSFCARFVSKGSHAVKRFAADPELLKKEIEAFRTTYSGANIENEKEYLELMRRLEEVESAGGPVGR